jgi:hypothetical protein
LISPPRINHFLNDLQVLNDFWEETMPVRMHRLSQRKEEEEGRCLQEMQAEGIDVDNLDQLPRRVPALDILVVGGPATLIFNLPSGLAGYAIWLRLVARKSGLIFPEYEITTKFDNQIVPESFPRRFPLCKLGQCHYPIAEVLNDRFPLKFHRRGHMIEGVILATGLEPIPRQYLQGMIVPFTMAFQDQFGNEISAEAKLSVDRSTKSRPRLPSAIGGLYDAEEVPATSEPAGRQPKLECSAVPDLNAKFRPKPAQESWS